MRYINFLGLQAKKGNIPGDILEHARVKAKSENLSTYSTEELKLSTIQTREELRKIQERAVGIRENKLQERTEAYIAEGKLPMGKALTILIKQE